jgi:PilZ domain
MPELVRSIIGRFCEIIGQHHHARRHDLRLPLTISLHDSKIHRSARRNSPPIISGHTRNISDTGLSLILPSVHFGNRYLMDGDLDLKAQIELPAGVVNCGVAPVRYEMLDENQIEWGYLVGLRITNISDQERRRLTEYLRQSKRSTAAAPKTNLAQNAQPL